MYLKRASLLQMNYVTEYISEIHSSQITKRTCIMKRW